MNQGVHLQASGRTKVVAFGVHVRGDGVPLDAGDQGMFQNREE